VLRAISLSFPHPVWAEKIGDILSPNLIASQDELKNPPSCLFRYSLRLSVRSMEPTGTEVPKQQGQQQLPS
jgi:hypothetical protein